MEPLSFVESLQALNLEVTVRENAGPFAVQVPAANLLPLMRHLHDHPALQFKLLLTHTAADWPEQGTIELLYMLSSPEQGLELLVSTSVSREKPVVPTLCGLWRVAEWQEREVYDMFGVLYDGHPDLRRLFLTDDWPGHPLRRDYQDDFMLEKPA